MGTRNLYEIELEDEFEKIKAIDIVSDEHRNVVTSISQLTDRLVRLKEVENERAKLDIEREKFEFERAKMDIERSKVDVERSKVEAEKEKTSIEKCKINIEEKKLKIEDKKLNIEDAKLEEDRKDRLIKNIIAGFSVAIPAGITLTGMVLMFLFEEKGTITSKAGSKIVDRIFRMK